MKDKFTVIGFSGLLLIMSLANGLKKDIVFSKKENRYLQTLPQITTTSLLDSS